MRHGCRHRLEPGRHLRVWGSTPPSSATIITNHALVGHNFAHKLHLLATR